ncbi:MAG: hypothetical protein ABRQ25_19040 [Clostridiaceae bacterium]
MGDMGAADVNLYAQWTPMKNDVTFNVNGAPSPASNTIISENYDSKYVLRYYFSNFSFKSNTQVVFML